MFCEENYNAFHTYFNFSFNWVGMWSSCCFRWVFLFLVKNQMGCWLKRSFYWVRLYAQVTTKKLISTSRNTDRILTIGKLQSHLPMKSFHLIPSVYTDKDFLSMYTKGITVGNDGMKNNNNMLLL